MPPVVGPIARLVEDAADLAVSAMSCWEAAYLVKRGRLILPMPIDEWLPAALEGSDMACLPLDGSTAARAAALADIHRDPADRFIIATALASNRRLLTLDSVVPTYPELAGCWLDVAIGAQFLEGLLARLQAGEQDRYGFSV